jgi:hypothetical protein
VGISLENTVSCYLHASPVLKAEGITILAQISTVDFDPTTTYTLTLSATAMPSGTGYSNTVVSTTAAAAVDEIAAAINAAKVDPEDPTATTIDLDGDGDKDTIIVHSYGDPTGTPVVAPALYVDFSATGGTGAWTSVTIDAATLSIKPWLKLKDRKGGAPLEIPWCTPTGTTWPLAVDGDGATARLNVAGYERLYVEEDAITERADNGASVGAHYTLVVAPAIQEE